MEGKVMAGVGQAQFGEDLKPQWMGVSSPNNLVDVHKLHVKNGRANVNKKLRDLFIEGNIQDIRDNFQV